MQDSAAMFSTLSMDEALWKYTGELLMAGAKILGESADEALSEVIPTSKTST